MEEAQEAPVTPTVTDDQTASNAALAPGTHVGGYVIIQDVGERDGRRRYLARLAGDDEEERDLVRPRPNEVHLLLLTAPTGSMEDVRALEGLHLRHPRLLALRDFFTDGTHDYATLDVPGTTWPIVNQLPLAAEEALATGVLMGEVVQMLHERGVAHGHLNTDTIVIATNGVFLSGIDTAQASPPNLEAAQQSDANQLAIAVGAFAVGATENPTLIERVNQIAAKGHAGGYTRVAEVVADCLRALPDGLPPLSEEAAQAPFSIQVGRATSVGMVRQQNQDALGILLMDVLDDQPNAGPGGVFLVADGMGGEARGEIASRIAARIIVAVVAQRFLSTVARATASDTAGDSDNPNDAATMMHVDAIAGITDAFRAANARIRNLARRLEQATGTTATAILLFSHELVIGHIGDSRAYLFRGGEVQQLTHDHSMVQRMIDMGFQNPEATMPRNYLYRSLGQMDDLEVDTRALTTGPGDSFMICSDGLWDLVSPEQIREVLASDLTPQEAAEELVRRANAAGGYDNSTAVVLRLVAR